MQPDPPFLLATEDQLAPPRAGSFSWGPGSPDRPRTAPVPGRDGALRAEPLRGNLCVRSMAALQDEADVQSGRQA